MKLFKKFVNLLACKGTIINCFAFFYASQFLSEFEGNFVFKCGRFGIVEFEEKVVNDLMGWVLIQLTSCEITNIPTEAMGWVRLLKRAEKKFGFAYFDVRNISAITSAPVASASAVAPASTVVSSSASTSASLKVSNIKNMYALFLVPSYFVLFYSVL